MPSRTPVLTPDKTYQATFDRQGPLQGAVGSISGARVPEVEDKDLGMGCDGRRLSAGGEG